jgi:hypothetical protein
MLFSERYSYRKIDNSLIWEEVPIPSRNRLWSRIDVNVLAPKDDNTKIFLGRLWDRFYKREVAELYSTSRPFGGYPETYFDYGKIIRYTKDWFFNAEWFEVYDFVEFLCEYYPDKEVIDRLNPFLNSVIEEENLAYRIIDGIVTPLIDKEEIKEIEKALNPPDKFTPIRDHLKKAQRLLADRNNPDYENSIKESISAVESLAKIITEKEKSLSGLIQSLKDIPFNLREGFKELYNWTSKDLRHGKSGKELPTGFEEAIYMMVTCSAFVNYVIAKYGEKDE